MISVVVVVALLCPTFCNPMGCSMPAFSVLHHRLELAQIHIHWVGDAMSIESVMPSSNLVLRHPFLLLPSIFPGIRTFSSELALCIRWPKYWSFSFSISPSSEYLGMIFFRIDWFDFLAVQGTLKSLLQHHNVIYVIWYMIYVKCFKKLWEKVVAGIIEETKWLWLWDVNSWRWVMDKIHYFFFFLVLHIFGIGFHITYHLGLVILILMGEWNL